MWKFKPYTFTKSKDNENGYFDTRPVMSYGCKIVIIIGARRIGKTFGASGTNPFADYGIISETVKDPTTLISEDTTSSITKYFLICPPSGSTIIIRHGGVYSSYSSERMFICSLKVVKTYVSDDVYNYSFTYRNSYYNDMGESWKEYTATNESGSYVYTNKYYSILSDKFDTLGYTHRTTLMATIDDVFCEFQFLPYKSYDSRAFIESTDFLDRGPFEWGASTVQFIFLGQNVTNMTYCKLYNMYEESGENFYFYDDVNTKRSFSRNDAAIRDEVASS